MTLKISNFKFLFEFFKLSILLIMRRRNEASIRILLLEVMYFGPMRWRSNLMKLVHLSVCQSVGLSPLNLKNKDAARIVMELWKPNFEGKNHASKRRLGCQKFFWHYLQNGFIGHWSSVLLITSQNNKSGFLVFTRI